ncbi:hypothetical protein HNQ59_003729 [Chitinivorax tropicus]|uniref:Nudix hydrolase domain-containing protein n=1 Tax=Chitinivorax tropicus TaxID=714531 RepID=A0A840MPN6_9PROT|nr:hypothetical protein [Chitinivorax tropicus]MBB5020410.1 hypothetical protein [Chitinivorax tropicus]
MISQYYSVLAAGKFNPSQVRVIYDSDLYSVTRDVDQQQAIKKCWEEARLNSKRNGRLLFSSEIFRLADAAVDGEILSLYFGNTDYKDYYATRLASDIGSMASNPLGSVVIPLTCDGYIPLARRSMTVDANPGKYFTFGGFFDRSLDWDEVGQPDIFGFIYRELQEEMGDLKVNNLYIKGVIYDCILPHPEIIAIAELSDSKEEMKSKNMTSDEFENVQFIHVSDIYNFVEKNHPQICNTTIGALSLFAEDCLDNA